MAWCCATPVRLVGYKGSFGATLPALVESARSFGESLGVAFQMIDDVIDYDTSGEKPFAQDLREGLVNFVTLEMLEHNPDLTHSIQRILGRVTDPSDDSTLPSSIWPWQAIELSSACDRVRGRAQAKLEVADQHLSQISKVLNEPHYESLQSLRSILVYLKERIR